MANTLSNAFKKLANLILKINLLLWILIMSILGIICGMAIPWFSKNYLGLLTTTIFLPMVQAIIVPLVFSTLVVGIAGHDDVKAIARMAFKSMCFFLLLTFIAIFFGLLFGNIFQAGVGADLSKALSTNSLSSGEAMTLRGELEKIIPKSFFKACAENEVLQIVFCSVMFAMGIILSPSRKSAKHMLEFCDALSHIMFKVTALIMNFVPLAVLGAFAETIAKHGLGVLVNLGKLLACVYTGLVVFCFVFIGICLLLKVSPIEFFRKIREPLTIAFATSSSEAALPLAMEAMVELGCPSPIVAFVIPTGYSFNLSGTTLYLGAAAVFAMQAGQIEKTPGEQVVMMLVLMLMSKGVAAVPRASLVVLFAGCKQFNLPTEAVGLILAVDTVLDMGRTAVNLIGNCVACVVVSKWEGNFRSENHQFTENVDLEKNIKQDEKQ